MAAATRVAHDECNLYVETGASLPGSSSIVSHNASFKHAAKEIEWQR
jgi:hypothetical protein